MRNRFRRSKGIPKLSAGYGQQGGCRRRGLRADQARRAPSRADGLQARVQKAGLHAEGQSRAEVDAVADAIPVDCIIVAPAYPKIGRTTRNGIHYVNDVRIDRTETAKDPKSPVAEADLVKLLASQSQRQAGLLPLEALRAGAEAASLRIGKLLRSGIEIIVCDAVSDEDLRRIADVAAAGVGRMLWAGSAGLAECLPDSLALAIGRGAHEHLSRVVPVRGNPCYWLRAASPRLPGARLPRSINAREQRPWSSTPSRP